MDGADRYRNPEHDLPTDFAAQRDHYYQQLQMPRDAEAFIHHLQTTLRQWLATLKGVYRRIRRFACVSKVKTSFISRRWSDNPILPIPPCSSGRSVGASRMWS